MSDLPLGEEHPWVEGFKYLDAEKKHYTSLTEFGQLSASTNNQTPSTSRGRGAKSKEVTVLYSNIASFESDSAPTIQNTQAQTGKKRRNKQKAKDNSSSLPAGSLAGQVHLARQQLQNQMQEITGNRNRPYEEVSKKSAGSERVKNVTKDASSNKPLLDRVAKLEKEKNELKKAFDVIIQRITKLENSVSKFGSNTFPKAPGKHGSGPSPANAAPRAAHAGVRPKTEPIPGKKRDDDDIDLFGSDSEGEDAAAAKVRAQRLAAYHEKKSKKAPIIAKSSLLLDVKPWDDETDMAALEVFVRSVQWDGLVWGASKLVPLAYGIHKLQISCVIEDDKVSVDALQEKLEEDGSEYVQSVDIAAFNKI